MILAKILWCQFLCNELIDSQNFLECSNLGLGKNWHLTKHGCIRRPRHSRGAFHGYIFVLITTFLDPSILELFWPPSLERTCQGLIRTSDNFAKLLKRLEDQKAWQHRNEHWTMLERGKLWRNGQFSSLSVQRTSITHLQDSLTREPGITTTTVWNIKHNYAQATGAAGATKWINSVHSRNEKQVYKLDS